MGRYTTPETLNRLLPLTDLSSLESTTQPSSRPWDLNGFVVKGVPDLLALFTAMIAELPTTDPGIEGAPWKNGSSIEISAGEESIDQIAGSRVWRASQGVSVSGSDLTSWADFLTGATMTPAAGSEPTYFASGGPENGPYIKKPAGKVLGVDALPFTQTPFSIYAVVRTPTVTTGSPIVYLGFNGGQTGPQYPNATRGYIYTGVDPYYSTDVFTLPRTEWMLLAIRFQDSDTLSLEVNDEPVRFAQQAGSGTAAYVISALSFLFDGIEVAELRTIPSYVTGSDHQAIKAATVSRYGLADPARGLMLLGDSHMAGVQAGTPSTGASFLGNLLGDGVAVVHLSQPGACADNNNSAYDFPDIVDSYSLAKWAGWKKIVGYGTNDCQTASAGYGWTSWANWKASYKANVQKFVTAGTAPAEVCLITPPYCSNPAVIGNLPTVQTLIREVAAELRTHLIDWTALCEDAALDTYTITGGDGLHANDTIHALLTTPGLAFVDGTLVTIYTQPAAATKSVGETATFSVDALGVTTYQWQKSEAGSGTWSNIAGATAAEYTTPAITVEDDGDLYRCLLNGSTTTDAVALSVAGLASATGGTITEVGGFRIHTFTTDADFVVTGGTLLCERVLRVAGGGQGGGMTGGGGGGGEVLEETSVSIPAGTYPVTIGLGGNSAATNATGASGGDTTFFGKTCNGGGGGSPNTVIAATGGSGGGGGAAFGVGGTSVKTAGGLGNAGGNAPSEGNYPAAGGGGAMATGSAPLNTDLIGGAGGIGFVSDISGVATYYGEGGGGGLYSSGSRSVGGSGNGGTGGHNGSGQTLGSAGVNGTGSGGGGNGGNNPAAGGAGGHGIVIIRYAI